jgi:hypothetical protein
MSGAVVSRRKNEHKKDLNLGDDFGLHHNALRLHLRRPTGQVWPSYAYWFTNADANSYSNANAHTNSNTNSDTNANADTNANTNADTNSNSDTNANSYSHPDSDPRAGAYSPTRNRCETESRHSGRSGSVDDLNKLDAHQSGTWNPPEHRQRPVHRRIRKLPTGSCWLPDWLRFGYDLDSFDRCVQDHTSSFRRLL